LEEKLTMEGKNSGGSLSVIASNTIFRGTPQAGSETLWFIVALLIIEPEVMGGV
jgi:hypothetical protein